MDRNSDQIEATRLLPSPLHLKENLAVYIIQYTSYSTHHRLSEIPCLLTGAVGCGFSTCSLPFYVEVVEANRVVLADLPITMYACFQMQPHWGTKLYNIYTACAPDVCEMCMCVPGYVSRVVLQSEAV